MSDYFIKYIRDLPKSSRDICWKINDIVHEANPSITSSKKWEMVGYSIDEGLICAFYVAKEFVTFIFYNGVLLKDNKNLFKENSPQEKTRTLKFTDIHEVESISDTLIQYIKELIENKKKGIKPEVIKKVIETPDILRKELKKNNLLEKFERMSYSMKKEYIEWIMEAKKEETRDRRIESTIEKIRDNQALYEKYKK